MNEDYTGFGFLSLPASDEQLAVERIIAEADSLSIIARKLVRAQKARADAELLAGMMALLAIVAAVLGFIAGGME